MAHPLRGECEAELAGKTYALKLDFGDFEALDAATQMGPLQMLEALHPRVARMPLICTVLTQAIRGEDGKRLPASQVKSIAANAGLIEAVEACIAIVRVCLTDPAKSGNGEAPGGTATTGE